MSTSSRVKCLLLCLSLKLLEWVLTYYRGPKLTRIVEHTVIDLISMYVHVK